MTDLSGTRATAAADGASLAERYARLAATPYEEHASDRVTRALDVALSGTALALLSPVLAAVTVAIRVASGRPVLYRGRRVGRAGRVFTMYKFRTLRQGAEVRLAGLQEAELSRRTEAEHAPLGRWLRASQLDELPQLWNVLAGDMSLVGPRPIRPAFFEQLTVAIPQYWQRLVVRPGLTGLAQLRMTRDMSWSEKLVHDLEYVADRSVRLYLRVLLATAHRLLRQLRGRTVTDPLT